MPLSPRASLRIGCAALILSCLAVQAFSAAASPASIANPDIVSDDIDRFWAAYDRIRGVEDPTQRAQLLQRLYLAPGSPGLQAFLEAKGCTAEKYADLTQRYPRFWDSVRPRSQSATTRTLALAPMLEKFRALYPAMRPATIYFVVGCMTSGGTTQGDKVLIGSELALGDPDVDVSELPERTQRWLRTYFGTRPADGLVLLNVHEYVHTQQKGPGPTLLAQSLYEGAADFVAEQVAGKLPPLAYVDYGPAHLEQIKARFALDMDKDSYAGWLYNGADESAFGVGDLGYFVGYAICKAYYERTADKREALRAIIELNYTDAAAARAFLDASGFYR
ncbi:MAG: hypothetical protein QM761_02965 [Pseudoxanthomonas sp.]